jgi:nucleoside-triphosphatase
MSFPPVSFPPRLRRLSTAPLPGLSRSSPIKVARIVDLGYITKDEQVKKGSHLKTPAQEKKAGVKKQGPGTTPEQKAMKPAYLLTGRPGTGKTSLIKQAIAGVKGKVGGFYTEEIRSLGVRQGFRLVTLDGRSAILAHINFHSPYRVSRYGVDVASLDEVAVSALNRASQGCDLVVVDEIGKMELFSAKFRETMENILESGKRLLGTIMLSPNPYADAIKRQPQVNLIMVTRTNHQQVLQELQDWLGG